MRIQNLFSLIFVGIMAVGSAVAYDSPNGQCYAQHVVGERTYDYVVYFENDRPKTGETDLVKVTGMANCVADLKQKLNSTQLGADMRILLLASTDKKASHAYNDQLSNRRLEIVKSLFDSKYQNKILTHLGGETNDNFTGTGNNRNPAERAVRILIASQQEVEKIINRQTATVTSIKETNSGAANDSAQRIRKTMATLRGMVSDFSVSVWKDANGNFNTARLVSDSVAGVVLGTAGGLITSNIIKKNQLKGGFESLYCTVGEQIVSGYNDSFSVGIQ